MRASWVFGVALGFALGIGFQHGTAKEEPRRVERSVYVDRDHGFKLQVPSWKPRSDFPATFKGPAERGFASNVNVAIQPASNPAEYRAGNAREMPAAGLKLNSQKTLEVGSRRALLMDYEGNMAGRPLHWLALAVFAEKRTILVTCTTTQAAWPKYEREFRDCLASFELVGRK